MTDVAYMDSAPAPGTTEINIRVDPDADGVVVRKASFLADGVAYELSSDYSVRMDGVWAVAVFRKKDGKTYVAGMDAQSTRSAMNSGRAPGTDDALACVIGNLSRSKSGTVLRVIRCVKAGDVPASLAPPVHSEVVRAEVITSTPPAPAPVKTWEEMTQGERDAALREAAIKLGLVKPS